MNDKELDRILDRASQSPRDLDPALLDRIAGSLASSIRPVRPLPPVGLLAGALILVCVGVALAAAGRAGFHGFQNQTVLQRTVMFTALGMFLLLAATSSVNQMTPGSRRRVAPGTLLIGGCATLLVFFAILFRDYQMNHFVSGGVPCLATGLLLAVPAGLASWLILRRGLALNPMAAALAAGTLSGLAGVILLELHCPSLQAPHLMLWHTGVVPMSAAVAALLAWAFRTRNTSSR